MIRPETLTELERLREELRERVRQFEAVRAPAAAALDEARRALGAHQPELQRVGDHGPRRTDARLVRLACVFVGLQLDVDGMERDITSAEAELEALAGEVRAAAAGN